MMSNQVSEPEDEIGCLEEAEMEGAWKCLCASMIFHAVRRAVKSGFSWANKKKQTPLEQEIEENRCVAMDWLEGGTGVVTFEECCLALGYDQSVILEGISRARKTQCRVTRRLV